MKTVKEFKAKGGFVVNGDIINPSVKLMLNSHGAEISNRYSENDKQVIVEFAWRTNTGVKPEFVGEVEYEAINGKVYTCYSNMLIWGSRLGDGLVIQKWRPHLPSIQTETPEEKVALDKIGVHVSGEAKSPVDAEMWKAMTNATDEVFNKPVYTQAMCDAGELPMVGSSVVLRYRRDIKSVVHSGTVKYASSRHCILDNGTCEVCLLMVDYEYGPIQTEREKAIEDCMSKFVAPVSVEDRKLVVSSLYDAGLLK